jgi:prephenate dehydrogenase
MRKRTTIAVIGGSGKMGRWIAAHLIKEGYRVIIAGRNQQRLEEVKRQLDIQVNTCTDAVDCADIVILSVPPDSFEDVVREIGPLILPEQMVIDITSIKTVPVNNMHKYIKKGLILGTHPMFGPGARDITGNTFVLTPVNEREQAFARRVEKYLKSKNARVIFATPEEHDEMISLILGLSHLMAIVTADTMAGTKILKKAADTGGITFDALLHVAGAVISEDPEFYASLQMNLPQLPQFAEMFAARAQQWANIVGNKDREQFIEKMNNVKQQFIDEGIDLQSAYKNLYKLAGKDTSG